MADVMRFRHADPKGVIRQPVDSSTTIEVGDLLFLDTDDVKPASDRSSAVDETTAKQNFANNFAGVAMDASASGDTADIAVATKGVFEFGLASGATAEAFDLVSCEADTNGDVTADQNIETTSTNSEAIASVRKRYSSNTTSMEVELLSIDMVRLSAF